MRARLLGVYGMVLALAASVGIAYAATATVNIAPKAQLVENGAAVVVDVAVRCTLEPGEELLEGNLSVSQDDAFGQVGLNPVCDGQRHVLRVRVPTFDGSFDRGDAHASAFLLFIDHESSRTTQFQDSTTLKVK
jgi:hypothetical protein